MLRTDPVGEQSSSRPAIPLADLAAVERFFDSLAWGGSIYGWRCFDYPDLNSDSPDMPSLAVQLRDASADHTFYWFNECGIEKDGETASYCIEGTIAFDDILVLNASGNEIPTETFIADGVRQWDALVRAYEVLGFDAATDGDEVFRALVLARIIEPTSKLDSLRVLREAGIDPPWYPTVNRRLPVFATG